VLPIVSSFQNPISWSYVVSLSHVLGFAESLRAIAPAGLIELDWEYLARD